MDSLNDDLVNACDNGNLKMVKNLFNQGANVNYVNKDNDTPLLCACRNGHFEIIKFLVTKGKVVIDHCQGSGCTPLQFSVDNPDIIKFLISEGKATVDYEDISGCTALIDAADEGYLETVKFLIDSGADVNHSTDEGWTSLIGASQWVENLEIAKTLVAKGADVNQLDIYENSPLTFAAQNDCFETIYFLIKYGANINHVDEIGNTFIDYLPESKVEEVKDFIHSHF